MAVSDVTRILRFFVFCSPGLFCLDFHFHVKWYYNNEAMTSWRYTIVSACSTLQNYPYHDSLMLTTDSRTQGIADDMTWLVTCKARSTTAFTRTVFVFVPSPYHLLNLSPWLLPVICLLSKTTCAILVARTKTCSKCYIIWF